MAEINELRYELVLYAPAMTHITPSELSLFPYFGKCHFGKKYEVETAVTNEFFDHLNERTCRNGISTSVLDLRGLF